jgi:hypothetical protein
VEIGGVQWMGVLHGGIVGDTLSRILDHSLFLVRMHVGGNGSFPISVVWNVK